MSKQRKAGAGSADDRPKVAAKPGEPDAAAHARTMLRPTVGAAVTLRSFGQGTTSVLELTALVDELSGQCSIASRGDLSRPEAKLIAQAHTLDAIFNSLARRAALNMGEYPDATDRYMRLALKAQSQCRATLETLAVIKNPPMVIARQANIAHGPQQVNNEAPPRTREIQSEPNKLLEQTNGERLDTGATGQAIGSDPAMATVGAFDRPENG